MAKKVTYDDTRDVAIRVVEELIADGYINVIDEDTHFEVQDEIHEGINELLGLDCDDKFEIEMCNMLNKFCWTRPVLQNCLVAVLSLTGAMSLAQTDSQSSFIRFLDGSGEFEGELQTAVNTYRNGEGVEVDLVAAVHIGEQDYFQTLNDYFSPHNEALYELLGEHYGW